MRLVAYYLDGYLAFITYRTIKGQLINDAKTVDTDILLTSIYKASYYSMIIVLANFLNPNRDSIDLKYLSNLVFEIRTELPQDKFTLFKEVFNDIDLFITKVSDVQIKIKTLRDNVIAHIDRINITNPDKLDEDSDLLMSDIEDTYHTIRNFLIRIGKLIDQEKGLDVPLELLSITEPMVVKKVLRLYDMLIQS